MLKKIWLLALAMVGAVLLSGTAACANSDFYVIAGGSAAVGTKITSLPCTITAPGFYYVTRHLTYSGSSDGITVNSDNVTIDLMGFCLSGPGSGSSSTAIKSDFMFPTISYENVEVRNGSLMGWEGGFLGGDNSRALNLRVKNCYNGIGINGLVKDCIVDGGFNGICNESVTTGNKVSNCSQTGINGSGVISGNRVSYCATGIDASGTISGNVISACSTIGIICSMGASVIGNTVQTPYNSTGIYISTLDPCLVTQNTVTGGGTPFHKGGDLTINVANTNAGF